eukprot:6172769-Pleurochrysis_carterae.AAC.1
MSQDCLEKHQVQFRSEIQGVWRPCMPPALLCKVLLSYITSRCTCMQREYTYCQLYEQQYPAHMRISG